MTARILVVLRHAKSDWSGHEPDRYRPLAARGRRQAREAGEWLAANLPAIDLAVVSPAIRTQSTWELASGALVAPPPVRLVEDIYAGSGQALLAVVRALPDDARRAVLVGHDPGAEDLVLLLTGESVELKTSAIAVIDLDEGRLLAHGRPPAPLED